MNKLNVDLGNAANKLTSAILKKYSMTFIHHGNFTSILVNAESVKTAEAKAKHWAHTNGLQWTIMNSGEVVEVI